MFSISVEPVLLQHPCMCQKQKSSPSVKSGTCELLFFLGTYAYKNNRARALAQEVQLLMAFWYLLVCANAGHMPC